MYEGAIPQTFVSADSLTMAGRQLESLLLISTAGSVQTRHLILESISVEQKR